LHPFDLRTAIFAKHAQHVVLIHFPIALFIVGVAFDYAGQLSRKAALISAAYYNLLVAAVSAVPAVATGLLAWHLQFNGRRLHGILLLHLVLGTTSAILIWLVWWLHFRVRHATDQSLPSYRLPLEALAVVIIALTGHLGGFLSGVNMPG
jgi:uncharacterized membrane protein